MMEKALKTAIIEHLQANRTALDPFNRIDEAVHASKCDKRFTVKVRAKTRKSALIEYKGRRYHIQSLGGQATITEA
jgi:hypothetical protein